MLLLGLREHVLLCPLQGDLREGTAAHSSEHDRDHGWRNAARQGRPQDIVLHLPLFQPEALLSSLFLFLSRLFLLCPRYEPGPHRLLLLPRRRRWQVAVCHRLLLLRQRWRLGRLAYGRPLGSGHRLEGSHGHWRRQRAVRCRHGLGGRAAGMREDGRGLWVVGLLICERGRRSRGAWRGWKIMDGPVAVLYWLGDGEHPRLSEWGDGG